LGLLIIYHSVLSFQPWARTSFFIKNEQSLEGLWIVMSMINIWRIPILFMVSGMGVRFAMEHRDWKQLLRDRTIRILVPFIFGFFFICPLNILLARKYYGMKIFYFPNAGHLWFLAYIFLYVLMLLPLLAYLKNHSDNFVLRFLCQLFRRPLGIHLIALPLMIEAWLLNPEVFSRYAKTAHGFCLCMICFIMGFIFISLQDVFWRAVEGVRWSALTLAILLCLARLKNVQPAAVSNMLVALESMSWMLALLGHGSLHLNKPSDRLEYFSKAVYPVYIIHMPMQCCVAYYLLPLSLPAILKLILLLVGTCGISLLVYEFVLSKLKWIRPLFGMKLSHR
jgi:hypothetical protein